MSTPFPTQSARLRYSPLHESDFPALLKIYNSNPDFMEMSEGSRTVTIETVEKDDLETRSLPFSHCIGIWEQAGDRLVGLMHFTLQNPSDKNPWLGLLMIHREKQQHGFAREALSVLHDWLRENEHTTLHLAVLEQNQRVVPFYQSCGYESYEWRETPALGKVLCMAKRLS
ncbi:GNAT family N-acetyltransferase [Brevibacillus fluminis]|uniref:GNAT family N-acetyltransferase n=1 Tax=Brevibacillus fluminis TaxID=511487 RepID=A0A3M8DFF2_9BACL|nr:GNAT family N-acetyltransferase [Brevibacillus fluminis]RNB85927.1 GNAT family N-acetyltransferase [Brevibacillus fluminis]